MLRPSACPYREATPPAIDASEVPKPGEDPPAPLPVPAEPMAATLSPVCGVVTAPRHPPLPDVRPAEAWLVADLDTGDIIAAKEPHGRHRPAEHHQGPRRDAGHQGTADP